MLLIAKKQNQAIKSAKNLIDFSNLELGEQLDEKNSDQDDEIISYNEHRSSPMRNKSPYHRKEGEHSFRSISTSSSISSGSLSQSKLTNMSKRQ